MSVSDADEINLRDEDRLPWLETVEPDEPEGPIRYLPHLVEAGDTVLHSACRQNLEGVVSKRLDRPYLSGRGGGWTKAKCRGGQEVVIGKGEVDFLKVFTELKAAGYKGAVTIERETSGPQQIEDVRQEKIYLERILKQIGA